MLDNGFGRLTYEEREAALQRREDIIQEFTIRLSDSPNGNSARARTVIVPRLMQEAKKEMLSTGDSCFELVSGVVLSRLGSLL